VLPAGAQEARKEPHDKPEGKGEPAEADKNRNYNPKEKYTHIYFSFFY
jgi:hypothetical protein